MKFLAFAVLLAVLLAAAHGASITGKRYGFGYSSHSHGGYLGGHHGGHGGHGGYGHGSYGHGSYGHGSYGHGSYGHGSYSHGSYGHGGYRGHHHG